MPSPSDAKPVIIQYNDTAYRAGVKQPQQILPESKKNPKWYFDNLTFCLSFYNQLVGNIYYPSVVDTNNRPASGTNQAQNIERPVQKMLRMIMYYLGEQPNLNSNHLTQNVSTTNMQAQWIKGQEVSEYVNHFRGLILARITNAFFTAQNISREAISEKEQLRKMLILKTEMKDYIDSLKAMGIEFNPANGKEFDFPEQIDEFMDKEYTLKDKIAEIGANLANGIWFSNGWSSIAIQSFLYTIICQGCAWEHSIINGRSVQTVIPPTLLISDPRIDDDYGRHDMFRGSIRNLTEIDIISQYPELMPYKDDIHNMANDSKLGKPYNDLTNNIIWWANGTNSSRNTVSVVKMYWKGLRDTGKAKLPNKYGTKVIRPVQGEEVSEYEVSDIYTATLIGNKYLVKYGLIDNLVEDITDKANPEFPIIKFQPNTFMGQSISEVARIHRIQDELDMLDFKMREMIGDAKGKVYIINGSKYGSVEPKEFMEDIASMKIHVTRDSGEADQIADREKGVEVIDWTLDPNVVQLANLYKERRDRMGKVLSTSDISMGQQTRYIGLGTQQSTINQSTIGLSYLLDGYMDFLVKNMRYAVNQLKGIKTIKDKDTVEMLVGVDGIKAIEFTKDMSLQTWMIALNINDTLDDAGKKNVMALAQAAMQNQQLTWLQLVKLQQQKSWSGAQKEIEYDLKKNKKEADEKEAKIEAAKQEAEAQGASTQELLLKMDKMASLFEKLTVTNLKGQWEREVAEVKAGLDKENKTVTPVGNSVQEYGGLLTPPQQQGQQGQPQQDPLGIRNRQLQPQQ